MRGIVLFVVIALIVASVQAVPESGNDCYDETFKVSVKRGDAVDVKGECIRLRCSDEGKLDLEPCEFGIDEGCHVVDGDPTQAYPDCCPYVKCEGD